MYGGLPIKDPEIYDILTVAIVFQRIIHLAVGRAAWIDVNRGYVIMLAFFPLDARYIQNFFCSTFHSFQRRRVTGTASAASLSFV